ncbi:MAG: hypothetical protein E6I83_07270 [Chloroflexi bacterium]|nr:MAG: hypothetical protein E6I83_07270 [Chloroflexota bacterium]
MRTQRDPAAGDARTDHDLVYAARDGDTVAFDALFYRYRDGIFRLGLAITKDPSAAEEIVVDTFARAHRALARLEPDDSLRPWLYRVAFAWRSAHEARRRTHGFARRVSLVALPKSPSWSA